MKRYMVLMLLPFLVTGCDKLEEMGIAKSKKEIPVKGKRETVLLTDDVAILKPDKDAGPVVLPAAEQIKEWHQAGHNASHAMPHAQAAAELNLLWESKLGIKSASNQRLLCEPIVAENLIIFYTPDSYVRAYDVDTGKFNWAIFIKPEKKQDAILGGGVAYNDGKLFVTTPFAELFALDIKAGKPLWMAKTNSPLRSAPTVAGGRVYVVSLNNEMHAYAEDTGQLLWTHAGLSESAGLLGGCTPSVHQNVVVAPYSSGEVFALQAENGLQLWTDSLASAHRTDSFAGMPHIRAKPVIKDGIAYVVSQAGRSSAYDLRTGDVLWQHEFGGAQTPMVVGDSLFMLTNENQIVCLDAKKGLIRWAKELPTWQDEAKNKGRIVWNGPVLAGSRLYLVASYGTLLALDATTGEKTAEHRIPGKYLLAPVVADGVVYVINEAGTFSAFK